MKKRISTLFLSIAMMISCLFMFTACGDKNNDDDTTSPEPPAVTVSGLSVELVNDDYTMTDGTITFTYGSKIELSASDFKVTASKSDETTAVVALKTDTTDGYTFASNIPADDKTPAGEYKLTFSYASKSAEVKIVVNKATIDMSAVTWDYEEAFDYDGETHTVLVTNLPEGVSVQYENNTAINAGEYRATAHFTYTDSANYEIASMTLDWTINKAVLSVADAGAINLYYDGGLKTFRLHSLNPVISYEVVDGVSSATNAGSYDVEVAFTYIGVNPENYAPIPNKTYTWVINKGILSIEQVSALVYTGDPLTLTAAELNIPTGVTVDSISDATQTVPGSYTSTVVVLYSEDALKNYEEVTERTVAWKIDKAVYDMSQAKWDYSGAFDYDGTTKTITVSGLPTGVTVDEYTGNSAKDAGRYTANVSFNYEDEYYERPAFSGRTWIINQKELIIKANDKEIYFGDDAANAGVTYTGFVTGENETTAEKTNTGVIVYTYGVYLAGKDADDYPIYVSDSTVRFKNYAISWQTGTLTVLPIEIDVEDVEWDYTSPYTYDATVQAPKLANIPTGVRVNYVYMLGQTTIAQPKNAGTYSASATFDTTSPNYTVINADKLEDLESWVIEKAVLTITAKPHAITFGEAGANDGVSYAGFAGTEDETVLSGDINYVYTDYEAGDDVGEYDINISTSTLSAINYTIVYQKGTLTVNPAEIDVSGARWNYTSAYSYNGTVQAPMIEGVSQYVTVNYVYALGQEPVAEPTNAGTYTANATFDSNSLNYTLVNNDGIDEISFVINKVSLTIAAKPHTIYFGDAGANDGVTFTGFVNGETYESLVSSSAVSGDLIFTYGEYEAGDDVGNDYTISIATSTLEFDNYEVSYQSATLTVAKATFDLSTAEWNKDVAFVYNKQPQPLVLKGISPFVEAVYTYTRESQPVANPIAAGVYTASVVISSTDNYDVVNAEIDGTTYEIAKQTILATDFDWELNPDATRTSSTEAWAYFTGNMHAIIFRNNSQLSNIAVNMQCSNSEPSAVGVYEFLVQIELDQYDSLNYVLEQDEFEFTYEIKDIVKKVEISYLDLKTDTAAQTAVIDSNSKEKFVSQDKLMLGISTTLVDDVKFAEYSVVVASDEYGSTVISDFLNIENLQKIYIVIKDAETNIVDVRVLNIEYHYENISVADGKLAYTTTASTYSIPYTSSNTRVTVSSTLSIPAGQENEGQQVETITLNEGITETLYTLSFTYAERTYSFSLGCSIAKTVDSSSLLKTTAESGTEGNVVSGNKLDKAFTINEIDDVVASDLVEPAKGYEISNSEIITTSSGSYYLKVTLVEKVIEPEPTEIALFSTFKTGEQESIVCYVLIDVQGKKDGNTEADIFIDGVYAMHGDSTLYNSQELFIATKNEYATIKILKENRNLLCESVGTLRYIFGEQGTYFIVIIATNGSTTERIINVLIYNDGPSGEPEGDVQIFVKFEDIIGSYVGEIDENKNVALGEQTIVSPGDEEMVVKTLEIENIDKSTLFQVDANGYLMMYEMPEDAISPATEGDTEGNEGDGTDEGVAQPDVLTEGYSHIEYRFDKAGTYVVEVSNKSSHAVLIVTVNAVTNNFMSATINDTEINGEFGDTLAGGDFVYFEDMLAEPDEYYNFDAYLEAYVGELKTTDTPVETIKFAAFESLYVDNLYMADGETKIDLADIANVEFEILTEAETNVKYIEFMIKGKADHYANVGQGLYEWIKYDRFITIRIYFCNKADRLVYNTISIGEYNFEYNADFSRLFDFGTVNLDRDSGVLYVDVEREKLGLDKNDKTTATISIKGTHTAYSYVVITPEGFAYIQAQINAYIATEEFKTLVKAKIEEFVANLMKQNQTLTREQALQQAQQQSGYIARMIIVEELDNTDILDEAIRLTTEGEASYAYRAGANMVVPVEFVKGSGVLYTGTKGFDGKTSTIFGEEFSVGMIEFRIIGEWVEDDGSEEGGNGGEMVGPSGPSEPIEPSYEDPLPAGLTFTFVVIDKTYTETTAEIKCSSVAWYKIFIWLDETREEAVTIEPGESGYSDKIYVLVNSITTSLENVKYTDIYGNEYSGSNFKVDITGCYFGECVEIRVTSLNDSVEYSFFFVFADSVPQGQEPENPNGGNGENNEPEAQGFYITMHHGDGRKTSYDYVYGGEAGHTTGSRAEYGMDASAKQASILLEFPSPSTEEAYAVLIGDNYDAVMEDSSLYDNLVVYVNEPYQSYGANCKNVVVPFDNSGVANIYMLVPEILAENRGDSNPDNNDLIYAYRLVMTIQITDWKAAS